MARTKVSNKYLHFYWQFIKSFSKIAIPLTMMLKITLTTLNFAGSERDFGRKPDFIKANSSKINFFTTKA